MDASRLQDTIDWLTDGARSAPTPIALMTQTCERLVEAGVPLSRAAAFVRTLHPDMYGRSFIWRPGAEVVVNSADFDIEESLEFKRSPISVVFHSLPA